MPQTKQAAKALRQATKKTASNKLVKNQAKTTVKKTRMAINAGKPESPEMIKKTIKLLDKALQKGIMKKNTVARRKSSLMRLLNKTQK